MRISKTPSSSPSAPLRPTAEPAKAAPTATDRLTLQGRAPATLAQAAERLEKMAHELSARGDRRGLFASVYAVQVRAMEQELAVPGRYTNPDWMRRMSLDFAQRYFDAFEAYERGDRAAVPTSWQRAFDHAQKAQGPAVNDLMLSMNAHINHDLPLSVAATQGKGPQKADFLRFNDALKASVDDVQTLFTTQHLKTADSVAAKLDRAVGPLDEWGTGQLIAAWRSRAWRNAQALQGEGTGAYAAITRRADWNARFITMLGALVPQSWVKRGLI